MLTRILRSIFVCLLLIVAAALTQNCSDEPTSKKRKNLKEPISFLYVEIWAPGAVDTYGTVFSDDDLDGVFEITDSNPLPYELPTGMTYDVRLYGWFDDNEREFYTEKDAHLVCFEVTNNVVSIEYTDEDSKGMNVGFRSDWTPTAAVGTTGSVKFILRHQPETKTGDCLAEGVTDLEITLPIKIIN